MRKLIYILLLVLSAESLSAQQHYYRQFTVDNGLPSSEVYDVLQDSDGYMWFATNVGVSRYDGYDFQHFDIGDGLPDNTIFELYEDYKGRIWFVSFSMKLSYYFNDSIYEYQNNRIIQDHFIHTRLPEKLSFAVDKEDNIYLGIQTRNILKISPEGDIKDLVNRRARLLQIFNRQDRSLVVNSSQFYDSIQVDSPDSTLTIDFEIRDPQRYLRAFAVQNDSSLYFSSGNRIFYFLNHRFEKVIELDSRVIYMYLDSEQNLWVGTYDGAWCFENASLNVKYKLLENHNVSSVSEDDEGGYWFTTLANGVFYMPFIHMQIFTTNEGLLSDQIDGLESGPLGRMWIGHPNPGISIMQGTETIKRSIFQAKDKGIKFIKYDSLSKAFYIICERGAFRYSVKNLKYEKDTNLTLKNPNQIVFINEDQKYITNYQGIRRIKHSEVIYNSCKEDNFCNRINAVFYDSNKQKLYLGGLNGLWLYHNRSFEHLGERNDKLYYRINKIDKFGDFLVLGTRGAGLMLYSKDTLIQFTDKEGLLDNSINDIYVHTNDIWIAFNKGVSRLKISDLRSGLYEISNLNRSEGLPSLQINDVNVCGSVLYIGTNNGLCMVPVSRLKKNDTPPPIHIKSVSIAEKDTALRAMYELPYNQNLISVTYVGLSYRRSEELTYRYRLKGLESRYSETSRNFKTYTSLPPGEYEFQVQAKNEDGVWSEEFASVSFHIHPPFWRTWWFITLTVGVISLLIWFVFYFRISMIRRRNELMQDINEYKQKILRQQMNPHFIFNTLNSIQYFLLDEDITSSLTYLTKFAKMMRIVLDNSQQTFVPIEDEIRGLDLYLELESLRFEESFDYKITIDSDINTFEYKIPALLLQPYVENSIRHGLLHKKSKGMLEVHITKNDDFLICTIEDNGVGRKRAEEIKMSKGPLNKSLGSKITEDRIKVLNSLYSEEIDIHYIDLEDSEGRPNGTRVEIKLPFIF